MPSTQIVSPVWAARTADVDYPITLAQAKAHLRVDTTDEDALIANLIVAATKHVEASTFRMYAAVVGVGYLDAFPDGDIILPVPASAVASVQYMVSGSYTAASVSSWVDLISQPARVRKPTDGWPTGLDLTPNAVKVTFTSSVDMLELAKCAILAIVGHWYEYREAFVIDGQPDTSKLPSGLDRVLNLLALPRV